MGNLIRVSVNQMKREGEQLHEQAEKLPAVIDELAASMEKLASCWEGAAWIAFQNQVASDIENMNKLCRFVSNFTMRTQNGCQTYLETEQKAWQMADRIRL